MNEAFRNLLTDIFPMKVLVKIADIITYPISLYYRRFKFPHLKLRKGTSDLAVFRKIFVTKDYNIDYGFQPRLIIDAGANVCYAAVYFATRFPEAQIVAVEPEESNYATLVGNVSKYESVVPIQKGLWNKSGFLKIIDTGSGNWGFMTEEVKESERYDVEVVTIDNILEMSKIDCIDILKIDIEGSEKEVFSSGYDSWLGKVRVLIVELHDDMRTGCSEAFYGALEKYNFSTEKLGENIIARNLDL